MENRNLIGDVELNSGWFLRFARFETPRETFYALLFSPKQDRACLEIVDFDEDRLSAQVREKIVAVDNLPNVDVDKVIKQYRHLKKSYDEARLNSKRQRVELDRNDETGWN